VVFDEGDSFVQCDMEVVVYHHHHDPHHLQRDASPDGLPAA
jgi:hypothetical protein